MSVYARPNTDADTIRRTAARVLEDPDYRLNAPDDYSFLIEWLKALLRPISLFFDSMYDASPVLFFIIVAILVIITVALIVHIGYSFKVALGRRKAFAEYQEASNDDSKNPMYWENLAKEAHQNQDYLSAIRFYLHAALLRLEQARKATLRRGTTNREYLRRYKGTPAFEPLELLVQVTDSRWFGAEPCTEEDVILCRQAHETITAISRGKAASADTA